MKLIEFETTGTYTVYINEKHINSIGGVPDGKTCEVYTTDGLRCEVKYNVHELCRKLTELRGKI